MNEFDTKQNISKTVKWIASPVDPVIKSLNACVFSDISSEAKNKKHVTDVGKSQQLIIFIPRFCCFSKLQK